MAELERLVVSLEARINSYERAMQRALGQTNNTARRIESRFAKMNRTVSTGFADISRGVAGAFAGAVALRGAQQLIDTSTRIENSLKVAGLAGEELSRVYDNLFASAQRNAAPLESLVTLYGRAAIVQRELGVSTQELLSFTDNVAVALRVAGTDAQSASGALLQLSQALGSGTVRAEEFNSILEGALPIAQAAAVGLEEAGGSVAKLRALVVEGKVSSEAFFRAFEAGSTTLQSKAASSELTVSQAFVRLQNVLVDVAGKFDQTTNASQNFANFLDTLGTKITEISDSDAFAKLISGADEFGNKLAAGTMRELEMIQRAIEAVGATLESAFRNTDVDDLTLELAQAEQAMVNLAMNTKGVFSPETGAAFQDLIRQLMAGRGNAELAEQAIIELGQADPEFAKLQSKISGAIGWFLSLRDAANAARAAAAVADEVGSFPAASELSTFRGTPKPVVKPVSLSDYAPPSGGSGGGSGGGGGSSPTERFAEALAQQERRTEMLRQETAALVSLNPLVNDYGYAIEKLRVQQELENAATEAGLELTPDRRAAINALAEGYATASVEADKLAEAQDKVRESMEEFADLAKESLRGFIGDLMEGKSAAEALGNALGNIGNKLLDKGLDLLFDSFFPFAEGGIAAFGRPKTFANGGIARTASIFGEAGPEAAVPLPDGRRIPVELRMPNMGAGAQNVHVTVGVKIDREGQLLPYVDSVVQGRAATIVGAAIKQNNKQIPNLMRDAQLRMG